MGVLNQEKWLHDLKTTEVPQIQEALTHYTTRPDTARYGGVMTDIEVDKDARSTICGKTAKNTHHLSITGSMDNVSCRRCLELLKEQNWHCSEHGFIPDSHVNFDETCEICNRPVA